EALAGRHDGSEMDGRQLRRLREELPPHHGPRRPVDAPSGPRRNSQGPATCPADEGQLTPTHPQANTATFHSAWYIILFEVLLTNHDSFAALLEVVLPLLTRIDDGTALHVHFRSEVDEIAKTHPDKLLRRFYAVLPNEVQRWPYGVSDAIEKIAAADGRLI